MSEPLASQATALTSSLRCPVDGDELQLVILDAIVPITAVGHQCVTCGGVLLDAAAQRQVLGQGLSTAESEPGHRPSPRTGEPMGRMEAAGIELDVCSASREIWFDRGELVVVRQLVQRLLETHKPPLSPSATSPPVWGGVGEDGQGPLATLRARCADCGVELTDASGIVDSPIGIVCGACAGGVGFDGFEAGGGSSARTTSLDGAAIAIAHGSGSGYRGEIEATLGDGADGIAASSLRSPSWWDKVQGLWRRPMALDEPRLEGRFVVRSDDGAALRALLARRGAVELVLELAALGAMQLELDGPRLTARLRSSQDAALGFEHVVRRLVRVYAAYAQSTSSGGSDASVAADVTGTSR